MGLVPVGCLFWTVEVGWCCMTEQEWLTCEDPQRILRSLCREWEKGGEYYIASDRKLRLFACACWRAYSAHWLTHKPTAGIDHGSLLDAVSAAEKFADNPVGMLVMSVWPLDGSGDVCAEETIRRIGGSSTAKRVMADIIRDIIGNPWKKYIIEESNNGSSTTSRDSQNPTTPLRHPESLGEGGSTESVDSKNAQGLAGHGGSKTNQGIHNTSHRWQQSQRRHHESSDDKSSRTSAVPRRRDEEEADRDGVYNEDNSMFKMQERFPREIPEEELSLQKVQESTSERTKSDTIQQDRNVILIKREWLTPTVVSLATAAYEERETVWKCRRHGRVPASEVYEAEEGGYGHAHLTGDCWQRATCVDAGRLDPVRLAVLADALEEAGCNVGLLHEHKDNATHYWYNDAFGKQWPHLTPDRAAEHPILAHLRSPGPHYRGCWVLDLLLGKE